MQYRIKAVINKSSNVINPNGVVDEIIIDIEGENLNMETEGIFKLFERLKGQIGSHPQRNWKADELKDVCLAPPYDPNTLIEIPKDRSNLMSGYPATIPIVDGNGKSMGEVPLELEANPNLHGNMFTRKCKCGN